MGERRKINTLFSMFSEFVDYILSTGTTAVAVSSFIIIHSSQCIQYRSTDCLDSNLRKTHRAVSCRIKMGDCIIDFDRNNNFVVLTTTIVGSCYTIATTTDGRPVQSSKVAHCCFLVYYVIIV